MAPNPAYDPIIAEASKRYNVPEETIRSVMGVESAGKPRAVSPKGASGLMQVMPETYNELARKHGLGPDRFEPRNNIMAGTAYLRENNDRFGGDWTKTLQAYNAGPGAVESGRPLPAETQAYVPKVQAGMGLTREAVINELRRRGKLPAEFDTPAPAPKLTREAVINELRRRGKLPAEFETGGAPAPGPAGDSSSVSAWGELGRGLLTGVDQLQGGMGFGLEAIGDKLGIQGLEDYGQRIRERNEVEQKTTPARVGKIEDVHSVGDFADYAAYTIGTLGPQVGAAIAGGGLAALAAPASVAGLAAGAAAAAVSFPMNAGEVFQNLLDKGIDRDTAMNIGLAAGIPMALLDAIVPGKVAGRLVGTGVTRAVAPTIAGKVIDAGGKVLKTGFQEGMTETMQEGTSILAEDYAGVAPTYDEAKSRLLNAGVAGAIGGGGIATVTVPFERTAPAPAVVAPPAAAAVPSPAPPPVAPPGAAPVAPVAPPPVAPVPPPGVPPVPVAAPATLPGYQPFFDQDGTTQIGWQSPDGSTVVAMGQSSAPLPTAPDLRTEIDQVVNSAKPVAEIVAGNDLHGLLPGEIEMPAYDPTTGEESPGFYHEASDTWRGAGEAPNFELSSATAEHQTEGGQAEAAPLPMSVLQPGEPGELVNAPADAQLIGVWPYLQTPPTTAPIIPQGAPPVAKDPIPPPDFRPVEHVVRDGPQRPPPPPRPALPGEPFVNPPPSADPTVSPKSLYDELRQRGEVKGAGIEEISKPPREGSVGDTWKSKRDADLVALGVEPETTPIRPYAQSVSMAEKALRDRLVKPTPQAIAKHLGTSEAEAARVLASVAGRAGSVIRQVQASKKERAAQGRGEGTVTAPRYRFVPRPTGPQTLIDLIASHGGLAPNGDLSAMDLDKVRTPGAGGMLVRKGGMTLDAARELAEEEGLLGQGTDDYQTTTINELLEALDAEYRGSKVSAQDKGARHGPQRTQIEAAARALGITVQDDWTDAELMVEIGETEAIRTGDPTFAAHIDEVTIDTLLADMGIFDRSIFSVQEVEDFGIPFPDVGAFDQRTAGDEGTVAPPAGDLAEAPRPDPEREAGELRQSDSAPEAGAGEPDQGPGGGQQKPTARVEKTEQLRLDPDPPAATSKGQSSLPQVERTDQGDQFVLIGELSKPETMAGKGPQLAADEGLFAKSKEPEPEQLDIEAAIKPDGPSNVTKLPTKTPTEAPRNSDAQKPPKTTPKINEIKAADLAGLDEASIDALLDEAFGGEEAQKGPEIPEGLKPRQYYRDGELVTAYARFIEGDRVRLKENGARGVVTRAGSSLVQRDGYEEFTGAVVKFDNGAEQFLKISELEAEAEAPKTPQKPPENISAARALFNKHFHFLTGLDEMFPVVEAFITGQQDFAATRAALRATIQKGDTWRESNGEKKASQLRADANLRALHADMKERGLSTAAPKPAAKAEGMPPPAQRKVAEMLKAGDVVTAGGSTRYVVKEVRHSKDGGKWKTTVIAYLEANQNEGFEHKLTGAHVEKGLILHDNPGIIKKAEGGKQESKKDSKLPSKLDSASLSSLSDQQSAADILKAAGAAGVKGADEALTGLYKLFGGNKLSSGFTFDEDTYKAAKPHFQEAYKQFAAAGRSLLDFARFIQSNFGDSAKPYLKRFLTEGAAVKGDLGDLPKSPNPVPPPKPDNLTDRQIEIGRGRLKDIGIRLNAAIRDSKSDAHEVASLAKEAEWLAKSLVEKGGLKYDGPDGIADIMRFIGDQETSAGLGIHLTADGWVFTFRDFGSSVSAYTTHATFGEASAALRRAKDAVNKKALEAKEEPKGTPPVDPAPEPAPGTETPTGEAVDAASVLASHGLKATRVTTKNGKPAWEISGNTHPVRDVLKGLKASWYGPKKVWTFWNDKDPSEEIAARLEGVEPQGLAAKGEAPAASDAAGAGRGAGNDPRPRRRASSDARLRAVRQREDARTDERADVRDAGAWVHPETQDLIRLGLKYGMPEEVVTDQIEDVALIHHAYAKGKKLFLLANEAGTGKTFVLGGAIRELRRSGAKSFTYITLNTDLIAQIKKDLKAYGVDDVQFFTYSDLSKNAPELPEGAVLIFDETHSIKDPASARGKSGQRMIAQAKFTIFSSATPFENPVQARYLAPTGIFDPMGGHTDFAKMYGASVRRIESFNYKTGKKEVTEIPYWQGGKSSDGIAARTWFMKQGIMTQRAKKLPPGMVDGVFRQSDVPQEWLDKYEDVERAYTVALGQYRTPDGKPTNSKMYSQIAMHRINMIKRVLEASKVDQAIDRAKHHLAEGKQVVIFVETKSDREVGKFRKTGDSSGPLYSYPEMALLMQRWEIQKAAAKGRSEEPPPFSDAILAIALAMHNLGVSFTLPSTSDEIVKALGKDNVAIYTGAVSGGIATKNKADFLAKRKSVLIATMAKGGTGLSLHDTAGDSPRVQIGLNLPWVASQVDQVSGRIARYGLQSKALIEWLFAGNIPFEKSLAQRVGSRMRDMGALVKGIDLQAASILTEFNLEEETLLPEEGAAAAVEVEPEGKGREPTMPELLAMAEKLERTRRKLDDTSGGAFFTPYPVAVAMRFIGGVFAGDRVLEPSAGHGALVRFLPSNIEVDMVERRRDNAEELNKLLGKKEGHQVIEGDFLEADLEGDYDTILMNPPFERAAGIGPLDIAHVRKAYDLLAEGGRLVAIMGEGAFFREQSHDIAFRDWLEERGATVVRLPENVFKNSGTGVRARMVVLDEGAAAGRSDIDLHDVETDSLEFLVRRIPVRERDRNRSSMFSRSDAPPPGLWPRQLAEGETADGWTGLADDVMGWATPEFENERARIADEVAELADRISGGRMRAKIFDLLVGEDESGQFEAAGVTTGAFRDLVAISLGSPDITGTVRHEAIHFLKAAGLLAGADLRVLEGQAGQWRTLFDIDTRYAGQPAEILNEEGIAAAYAAWGRGELTAKGPVARAFQVMKRFFEAVKNLLAGNGFRTAQSVFAKIERGEVGRGDRDGQRKADQDGRGNAARTDGTAAGQGGQPFRVSQFMLPPRRQGNLGQPYTAGQANPAPAGVVAAPVANQQGNLFSVRTHLPDKSMVEWLMDANYSLIQRVQGATSRAAIGVSVDRFRQLTQDRYIRLRRVQEAVTGGTGRVISQAENTYLAEELYTSKAGEKLFRMDRDHKKPILEAIHSAGLTVEQVDKYLYARHAKERNARISRINPRFPAGEGSGMTDADAQGIINAFTVLGILPQLDHIANLVDRMTNATLQERVNGGLMSAQEALKWQQTYRHYVPLRGLEQLDDAAMRIAGGQGYNVRGPESQRALGRKSRAESILGNVFMMADEAVIRSEKNQVVISLMNLVNNNSDPTYWQVDKVTIKPVFNKATGLVEYRATTKLSKQEEDRTVRCKVNGHEHRITIHDARLMTALKNLEATKVNMLIAGMMKFNRYLSTVNTGLNPEFLITNLFRDLQAGFINMTAADLKGLQTSVLRDYRKALFGAWGGVRGRNNTVWAQHFRDFAAAGGKVSFYQIDNLDEHKTKIDLELRRKARGPWHVKRKFKELFDAIADANAAVDNGIRLAVFVNARRLGKTDAEAASLAKNLTINFNRRGELGPVMNSAYLFFNAGVQGTAVLVKALKHKKVRKIAAGIVVAGFIMEMMNAMISPDDDDGEDKYSKIPDFTKSRNFIIMSPDGTAITFPMPYGYNVFADLGRNFAALVRGHQSVARTMGNIMKTSVDAFNPIGGTSSLLNFVSPTVIDPIVDLERNEDFAGRKIAPETPFDPSKPDSQQYWSNTGVVYRTIAEQLNDLTGGNEWKAGGIDVSPESLDYLWNWMFGGAGAFVARVLGLGTKFLDGTEITMNDVPFARKVVARKGPGADRSLFYERAETIEALAAEREGLGKAGRTEEADALKGDLLKMATMAENIRTNLATLRKRRDGVKADGSLTSEERQQRLDELAKREKDQIDHFNRRYVEKVLRPEQEGRALINVR